MRPVQATPDTWGIDTNVKITPQVIRELKTAKYIDKLGVPQAISFILRYVSLGSPSPADITVDEAQLILDAGFQLGLVQHVKYPGWIANGVLGTALGTNAARHAASIGYPNGCMLGLDDEGVANPGPEVTSFIISWAHQCSDFQSVLYVGYACGLTPDQLWSIPNIHLYWSDFGPRQVPHRGFAMKQYNERCPGVSIPTDMDHIMADDMNGLPVLAVA